MKKSKCVILRTSRMSSKDMFSGPFFNTSSVITAPLDAQIKVEIEELSRRDIPVITRDADILALAPAMPMTLIAPVSINKKVKGDDTAWGVKAVRADTSRFSGENVVVAILDTGIDLTHSAFTGIELVQRNFINPETTVEDDVGHGTHCAGTVFGRAVEGVRIGVAPGVKRALIGKVLGKNGGSTDAVISGIQWAADSGAHIISMSLGFDFPRYAKSLEGQGYPFELAVSRALEGYRANVMLFERLASFIRARANPTIIVAASGNESRRSLDPRFEISVSPPAVSDGIISVAAVGKMKGGWEVADFSNTGASVSGPGVDVISANVGGGLIGMSGTSMATPHVAGVAALWAQAIMEQAPLSVMGLTSRLVGSGTYEGMKKGFDAFDLGAGLVVAPQN